VVFIVVSLWQLILLIWKSGKVPADWKEAVIISLYKGKGYIQYIQYLTKSAHATDFVEYSPPVRSKLIVVGDVLNVEYVLTVV